MIINTISRHTMDLKNIDLARWTFLAESGQKDGIATLSAVRQSKPLLFDQAVSLHVSEGYRCCACNQTKHGAHYLLKVNAHKAQAGVENKYNTSI